MYTNIPNHEGILAVAEHLRRDPEKPKIGPHLLKLLELVLHSMSFNFNGDHYLQTRGTAMGTAAAPNYANVFMDRSETKALENCPLKPLLWLRFIDDIFMIWTHREDKLQELITYLNSIHPTIKFTHEFSYTHISFLDTTVKINERRELYTTLYGQFLRLRRIIYVPMMRISSKILKNSSNITLKGITQKRPLENITKGHQDLPRMNY